MDSEIEKLIEKETRKALEYWARKKSTAEKEKIFQKLKKEMIALIQKDPPKKEFAVKEVKWNSSDD